MISSDPADIAVEQKCAWKSALMQRYAVALVKAAIQIRRDRGIEYFNSDDVPPTSLPNDKTTIGAATRLLLAAGVIGPFRDTLAAFEIFGGIRRSSRPCCNGHRNQLYRLVSLPLAEEFLRRNGVETEANQLELSL